jgi:hypothetical protein
MREPDGSKRMMNERLADGGPDSDLEGAGERHIPIEIAVGDDAEERPPVDAETRVDVEVDGRMYPTARLEDGRYVSWWFDTDPPDLDDPVATEWVAAPTRFLAAGTLHELWEDPAAFDDVTGARAPASPDF